MQPVEKEEVVPRRRTFLIAGAARTLWSQAAPPNVVLFLADDLGSADLSCYGATDIRTPHIDAIGRAGVRFTQAYCNAPECTPSRAALLTARYQQRVGGLECAIGVGNVGRYDEAVWLRQRNELGLPATETTLAQILKARGYDTACFGKWHLGYEPHFLPRRHGFDEFFGPLGGNADYYRHVEEDGAPVLYHNDKAVQHQGYLTGLIGDAARQWLRRRSSRPFFLYVPFTAPHSPYQSHRVREIPKGGWNRGDRKTYAEMVEAMDEQIGAILRQLDQMRLADRTWVIFLSDNGGTGVGSNGKLRGGKSQLWEGGIRTPCLMRWPGVFAAGSETAQLTLTMDITASIAAAAGAQWGRPIDGENLLAIWQRKQPLKPRTVFWRYRRGENLRKAVRQGDWKLVIDGGRQELHHLGDDPYEQKDAQAEQPELVAELKRKLAAWEEQVRAPRLKAFYESSRRAALNPAPAR